MARWLHEIQASASEKRHDEAMGYADDLTQQMECLRKEVAELTNLLQKVIIEGKRNGQADV